MYWFLLAIVVVLIVIGAIWSWELYMNWRVLVAEFGLTPLEGDWKVERFAGHFRGRVFTLEIPFGRRNAMTKVIMPVRNRLNKTLIVAEDDFYRKSESFGAQIFKSGDAAFDKRFVFKSHSPEIAKKFFAHKGLCHKLQALNFVELSIVGDQLEFGQLEKPAQMKLDDVLQMMSAINDCANFIESLAPIKSDEDILRINA